MTRQNPVKVRFPCDHGQLFKHMLNPNKPGRPEWCNEGRNVMLEGVPKKCFEREWYTDDTIIYVEVPEGGEE
jgi:hypothetical protein